MGGEVRWPATSQIAEIAVKRILPGETGTAGGRVSSARRVVERRRPLETLPESQVPVEGERRRVEIVHEQAGRVAALQQAGAELRQCAARQTLVATMERRVDARDLRRVGRQRAHAGAE